MEGRGGKRGGQRKGESKGKREGREGRGGQIDGGNGKG